MEAHEIAMEMQRIAGRTITGQTPAGALYSHIEKKIKRLARYREGENATPQGIEMMERDIQELTYIYDELNTLYPFDVMKKIAKILQRNIALGDVDLTVLVVPTTYPIKEYPFARIAYEDITKNYHELRDVFEAHSEGGVFAEVDDLSEQNLNDILKLYANRGELCKNSV